MHLEMKESNVSNTVRNKIMSTCWIGGMFTNKSKSVVEIRSFDVNELYDIKFSGASGRLYVNFISGRIPEPKMSTSALSINIVRR